MHSSSLSSSSTSSMMSRPWDKYQIGSSDWYKNKYILDFETATLYLNLNALNLNNVNPNSMYLYTFIEFSYTDFDIEKYYDKSLSQYVIPQDLVENEMKNHFGNLTDYDRKKCDYYSSAKKAYISQKIDDNIYTEMTVEISQVNQLKNDQVEIKVNCDDAFGSIKSLKTYILQGSGNDYFFVSSVINQRTMPWDKYQVGSKSWFLEKYIGIYNVVCQFDQFEYPLNKNFINPDSMCSFTYYKFPYTNFNFRKYLDNTTSLPLVPQELVESEMKKHFGDLSNYDRNKCQYYSTEKKEYACVVGGYGTVETIEIDEINKLQEDRVEIKTRNIGPDGQLGSKRTYIMQGSGDNYVFLSGVLTEVHKY